MPGVTVRAAVPSRVEALEAQIVALIRADAPARLPPAAAIARQLGVSVGRVHRILRRLMDGGLLRETVALRTPQACRCVAYLSMRPLTAESHSTWEERLRADDRVLCADRITGSFDYRLRTVHRDLAAAQAWLQELVVDGFVANGELQLTRPLFERCPPRPAAAGPQQ